MEAGLLASAGRAVEGLALMLTETDHESTEVARQTLVRVLAVLLDDHGTEAGTTVGRGGDVVHLRIADVLDRARVVRPRLLEGLATDLLFLRCEHLFLGQAVGTGEPAEARRDDDEGEEGSESGGDGGENVGSFHCTISFKSENERNIPCVMGVYFRSFFRLHSSMIIE